MTRVTVARRRSTASRKGKGTTTSPPFGRDRSVVVRIVVGRAVVVLVRVVVVVQPRAAAAAAAAVVAVRARCALALVEEVVRHAAPRDRDASLRREPTTPYLCPLRICATPLLPRRECRRRPRRSRPRVRRHRGVARGASAKEEAGEAPRRRAGGRTRKRGRGAIRPTPTKNGTDQTCSAAEALAPSLCPLRRGFDRTLVDRTPRTMLEGSVSTSSDQ